MREEGEREEGGGREGGREEGGREGKAANEVQWYSEWYLFSLPDLQP